MSPIPLSEPVISGNEWMYVKECLDTGWVSSVGSFVDRFEQTLADYTGAKYAVAMMNGTAALHLSLLVAGVTKGDEVLVPTLTFIAPVNTVRYVGAEPVFFDCDPETLCIDVNAIAAFLQNNCDLHPDGYTYNRLSGRRVSAVIVVDVFGHPIDRDPLVEICEKKNVRIIEDASESLGSRYKGTAAGMLGDIGCLSFNGNKIITTGGGGMLLTNNAAWARHARHLSTQAKSDSITFDHDEIGYNYRLTNIQAALGLAQMEQLDTFVETKRRNATRYRALLSTVHGVQFLWEQSWAQSNFWFYTIRVPSEQREALMESLLSQGIEVRPVWKLIHTLPMYRDCQTYHIQHALTLYETCLNLPCSVSLEAEQMDRVVAGVKAYFHS